MKYILFAAAMYISFTCRAETIYLKADGYIKPAELNIGDTLIFELKNGSQRFFVLESSMANSFMSFSDKNKSGRLYSMSCRINANGQSLDMHRLVPANASFYQPLLINDVWVFFDGVNAVDAFMEDGHGIQSGSHSTCYPKKQVRLALMEYGETLCPDTIGEWIPHRLPYFTIDEAYHGGDCWMGPYGENEAHNGLDINVENHTPLWAPIALDSQFYFNSVAQGSPNNRWNGFRNWPNGDRWMLRSHHMTKLLVPEHTPLAKHQWYGEVGGLYFGDHPHCHFYFTVTRAGTEYTLDPWIVFWQIFENRKQKEGAIKADFEITSPGMVGVPLQCNAQGSRAGIRSAGALNYFWATSDGGFGEGVDFSHTFAKSGVHSIALTVTDGTDTTRLTRHVSVAPGKTPKSQLLIRPVDSLSFKWPVPGTGETYGNATENFGRYIDFYYRKNEAGIAPHTDILLQTPGIKKPKFEYTVSYMHDTGWINCSFHKDTLGISLNTARLNKAQGTSVARIYINCGEHQEMIMVRATAPYHYYKPGDTVVVDESEALLFPSNFYWVKQPYRYGFLKGVNETTTYASELPLPGTPTVRYVPDLTAGTYSIQLHPEANIDAPQVQQRMKAYRVKVQTATGPVWLDWEATTQPVLGTFRLSAAKASYVDLMPAAGNETTVMDALMFVKVPE